MGKSNTVQGLHSLTIGILMLIAGAIILIFFAPVDYELNSIKESDLFRSSRGKMLLGFIYVAVNIITSYFLAIVLLILGLIVGIKGVNVLVGRVNVKP